MAQHHSAAAPRRFAFLDTPWPCRAWISATVLAASVLPFVLAPLGHQHTWQSDTATGVLLVGLSIVNVEIGRLLERGISNSQRPHKALSAWVFAAALLLPTGWLLLVAAVTYAHARWRGMRVTLWKWIGSAAYVVLAGLAGALAAYAVLGDQRDLMLGAGGRGLAGVLVGAAVFLVVQTVLFHGSAYLNDPADEVWLRQTLASPSFYLTEAAVLLVGGLSAAIWTGGAWFVLLLAPVYALTQRAALHEPLRERADHDDKTGVLRFESWRRMALAGVERCHRSQRPWCVLFADLDHFKAFNDTWGHLVGDRALVAVADAIRAELRSADLLARFGGEEFCVFLPDTSAEAGLAVAERIRCAVGSTPVGSGSWVTISVGIAAAPAETDPSELVRVLTAADRALFRAKEDGRNRTGVELLSA